ncbi:hypothetical protein HMPREF0731_2374, partial [Pseudoroseomonas cervicalis ATCC 49957]
RRPAGASGGPAGRTDLACRGVANAARGASIGAAATAKSR